MTSFEKAAVVASTGQPPLIKGDYVRSCSRTTYYSSAGFLPLGSFLNTLYRRCDFRRRGACSRFPYTILYTGNVYSSNSSVFINSDRDVEIHWPIENSACMRCFQILYAMARKKKVETSRAHFSCTHNHFSNTSNIYLYLSSEVYVPSFV